MKTVNNFLAICVVLFAANSAFVTAQEKSAEKPANKIENLNSTPLSTTKDASSKEVTTLKVSDNPYKNQSGENYRIGFRDTLEVVVDRHPELSQRITISPDGTIRLFRIDDSIVAVCKTEEELRNVITNHYKNYLKRPAVKVTTVDKRTKSYGVIGAVQKPGVYYYDNKISLLDLLTLAGGPNVEFAGSKIQIARNGAVIGCAESPETDNAEENVEFFSYSLNDVQKGKVKPIMQPGDVVSLLIAEEAYIVGNVVKPTKIILNEPKTLTQALAAANGTDKTANTEKVIIQRHDPQTGIKKELVFNLKDIRDQKIPDPQLQANDIVQVSNDKFKSVKEDFKNIFKGTIPTVIRGY